jgi:cell division protein FtsA
MRALDTVVNARMNELFAIIRSDLDASGALHRINGGVVLTGGGARTANINTLARSVFGGAARTGVLIPDITGLENDEFPARYATIAGALLMELKNSEDRSLFDPITNLWKKFFSGS